MNSASSQERTEVVTGLDGHAVRLSTAQVEVNLVAPRLVEHALANGEAELDAAGALVVDTGQFTGRSPKDKFIVRNAATEAKVDWGAVNQPMEAAAFERLRADMEAHLAGRRLYVQDVHAGTDPRHRLDVRVVTEYAWHSLFARNLFVDAAAPHPDPDWLVVDLPSFRADPERHGTTSSTVVALDFEKRLVLIGNTEYAGEIKKSIFSALNMVLPDAGVFPMHCSANQSPDGRTALFFGLSGTGKTTLSADGHRHLIGDDEHGWSADGVFNFEGGCYAKVVNLSEAAEPQIYAASQRFGAVLENVRLDPVTRVPDFSDVSKTENTRSAYPIGFVPNASREGLGGHPQDIVFLSADAFGVLPPIARLTTEQAMYHFLSGYTAKVAGTERGVTEPSATFSACFGAPFMSRPPVEYARMLEERLEAHGTRVWLLNTGWTGGGYGVGSRIQLAYSRALVRAALHGVLDDIETYTDPVFGLAVPVRAPGVPAELLRPRDTWADGAAYDAAAAKLAGMFRDNFRRFEASAGPEVTAAGPRA
ncbi:MAG: phosphoenolpyruvate carboxykinase (ATP) [Deinococcales bacterium]|mgnify:CR=1 FL=1|nr:phosphoenolpyruvate carboxykinase (ATP) [Deinococcales bacterium]